MKMAPHLEVVADALKYGDHNGILKDHIECCFPLIDPDGFNVKIKFQPLGEVFRQAMERDHARALRINKKMVSRG